MTKKNLKERMVVETREGNRYLVCGNSMIRDKGFCSLSSYEENLLTIGGFSSLDIVKVYDTVNALEDITDPNLPLIWERKHTPEIGDIYFDDVDGEKFIIIAIDNDDTMYPYITMNVYKNSYRDSNTYSESELQEYKFIGTDTNIAKMFNEAFEVLKDYKS
jgi:hypothetical protein